MISGGSHPLDDLSRRLHVEKRLRAAAVAWRRDVGEVDLAWSVGVNLACAVDDWLALAEPAGVSPGIPAPVPASNKRSGVASGVEHQHGGEDDRTKLG
jgi:hypothetical protein